MIYYKDTVIVMPKQKRAVIKRQFYKNLNGRFKRIKRRWNFIKEWNLKNDIPKEEYKTIKNVFDNTAFNNDDREYSTEVVSKRYIPSKIKEIEDYIKSKYKITDEFKAAR